MTEHTPGPWRTGENVNGNNLSVFSEGQIVAFTVPKVTRETIVADCAFPANDEGARANARLIADRNRMAKALRTADSALNDAREFIDGQIDVVDGSYGEPAPNRAMSLAQVIDEAAAKIDAALNAEKQDGSAR